MSKSKITVRSFVLCPDGPRPLEDLSPREKEAWLSRMRERLSVEMSEYFHTHKEDLERLERRE